MSGSRKALKVIAIIMIVFAAFTIVAGLLLTLGFSLLGDTSGAYNVDGLAIDAATAGALVGIMGIMAVIMGIVYLLIGILGVRGANNPKKIGPFYVLSLIGAAFGIIGLIMSVVQGSFNPSSLIGLGLVIACAALAHNIKKESL